MGGSAMKTGLVLCRAAAVVCAVALAASTGMAQEARTRLTLTSPPASRAVANPLASARAIFVDSESRYLDASVLETELRKRREFSRLGLSVTRDRSTADVVVEVRRARFTTKFTYTAIDKATSSVVASGQVSSLFGTAAGRIAKRFLAQVVAARGPGAGGGDGNP